MTMGRLITAVALIIGIIIFIISCWKGNSPAKIGWRLVFAEALVIYANEILDKNFSL